MLYELRLNDRACALYASLEEALKDAKTAIMADPDSDPEIIDQRTGRAPLLCASKRWREEIAQRLGY
jgi:hypothetical protein